MNPKNAFILEKFFLTHLAKNSAMFSPKDADRLKILQDVGSSRNQLIWMGLNDIKTEDVFVWEDDGSVLTDTWRRTIFGQGTYFVVSLAGYD